MSVYFIQRGIGGPIKIGTASRFFTRYRKLQSEYVEPLYIRALIKGDRSTEREYHNKYWRYRLTKTGEWFSPAEEIISYTRMVRPTVLDALKQAWPYLTAGDDVPVHILL